MTRGVSEGIQYLHRNGIVHGDIEPTNILVDDAGDAKLWGFGLAVLEGQSETEIVTTAEHSGTEQYRAPEHLQPNHNRRPLATSEGDINSLGCIILEFVLGVTPFSTKQRKLGDSLILGDYPASPSWPSGWREELWNFLYTCWNDRASERPKIDRVVSTLKDVTKTLHRQNSGAVSRTAPRPSGVRDTKGSDKQAKGKTPETQPSQKPSSSPTQPSHEYPPSSQNASTSNRLNHPRTTPPTAQPLPELDAQSHAGTAHSEDVDSGCGCCSCCHRPLSLEAG